MQIRFVHVRCKTEKYRETMMEYAIDQLKEYESECKW